MRTLGRRKTWVACGSAALLSIVLAACGSTASGQSSTGSAKKTGTPYTVGINIDLSGFLAFQGNPFRQGFTAYFDQINGHGGVHGRSVKVVSVDDQSQVQTALANITELATADHVSVVVGMLDSTEGVAIKSLLARYKLAALLTYISPAQNGPYEYGLDSPIANEPRAQVALAETLMAAAGITTPKIAMLVAVTPVLAAWQSLATSLVRGKGWPVVSTQSVALSGTDLSAQAAAIAKAHPSVVLTAVPGNQAIIFTRDLRGDGSNAPVIEHTSGGTVQTFQALQDPTYYAIRSRYIAGVDNTQGAQAIVAAAKASGTSYSAPFYADGYANALVVADVLRKCPGACDSAQFNGTLEHLGVVNTGGITQGPLDFTPSYHDGYQYVRAYHWSSSKDAPVPVGPLLSIR